MITIMSRREYEALMSRIRGLESDVRSLVDFTTRLDHRTRNLNRRVTAEEQDTMARQDLINGIVQASANIKSGAESMRAAWMEAMAQIEAAKDDDEELTRVLAELQSAESVTKIINEGVAPGTEVQPVDPGASGGEGGGAQV